MNRRTTPACRPAPDLAISAAPIRHPRRVMHGESQSAHRVVPLHSSGRPPPVDCVRDQALVRPPHRTTRAPPSKPSRIASRRNGERDRPRDLGSCADPVSAAISRSTLYEGSSPAYPSASTSSAWPVGSSAAAVLVLVLTALLVGRDEVCCFHEPTCIAAVVRATRVSDHHAVARRG